MSTILDPTGRSRGDRRPLAPRPRTLDGLTVGLLDSSKRNSDILLAEIGSALKARYGAREVMQRAKPTFTVPAPADLVDEMAARCHVIVTGVGD